MGEKTAVFLGIDPGTTTAFAALNEKGRLLKLWSMRNAGFNVVLQELLLLGYPVFIATDKARVPRFIAKLAAQLQVKVITPKKDLTQQEKRLLLQGYASSVNNTHEADALAAVLDALRHVQPLMKKVLTHPLLKEKKTLFPFVLKLLLTEKAANIHESVAFLLEGNKEPLTVKKTPKKLSVSSHPSMLEQQLQRYRLLEQAYHEQLQWYKQHLHFLERQRMKEKDHRTFKALLKRILTLEKDLEAAHEQQKTLEHQWQSFVLASLHPDVLLVVHRPDLTKQSLQDLPQQLSLLAVDDARVYHLPSLKKRGIKTILTKLPPKHPPEGYFFLSVPLEKCFHGFALVNKKNLEEAWDGYALMQSILDEYKREKYL